VTGQVAVPALLPLVLTSTLAQIAVPPS